MTGSTRIRRLGRDDVAGMRALNAMFAEAFEDPEHYAGNRADDDYLAAMLARPDVIALAAVDADQTIGGLVAYVLPKLEQQRSEVYIYDLAVVEARRRKGIATALIDQVRRIAADISGWVVYVQADYGDEPAVALYTKLGTREDVMHFDIPVTVPR